MPSIKVDAKIVLAVSVGCKLCACSTTSVNFNCLNVASLCLATVEFPHSENLSCNRVFMAGQFLPAECNSLKYLCSDPLKVANAMLSGSLHEKVGFLDTSSNQVPKSFTILPSYGLALLNTFAHTGIYGTCSGNSTRYLNALW